MPNVPTTHCYAELSTYYTDKTTKLCEFVISHTNIKVMGIY